MMKNRMKGSMGKMKSSATGKLHEGLTDKGPAGHDASMEMKGAGHVDDGAIRSSVAPTPRTLGPRTA